MLNKEKEMGICLAGNGLNVFTTVYIYEVFFLQLFHFFSRNAELLYAHVLYLSLIVNN